MSNRDKLLLSFADVTSNTRIQKNVSESILRPIMLFAQEVRLQQVIGESLYVYLLDSRNDNGSFAFSSNTIMNTAFVDYITPLLYRAAEETFLNSNAIHLSEIGLQQTTGPNSNTVDREELKFQRQTAKSTTNWYISRLQKYICHTNNWPTFSPYYSDDQQNVYPDSRSTTVGGIWVPPAGFKRTNYTKRNIP